MALFLFCCLLISTVIAGLVPIPQHLRRSALQQLGWFWDNKPDLSITAGLNLPPFGIRMNRDVKQQVVGRSQSRLPFQTLRCSSDFQDGEQQVICMPLPHSVPPFHLLHEPVSIPGIQGLIMDAWGPIKAVFQDTTHGRTVIDAIAPLPPSLGYNRLTIDHDQSVLLDVNQELKTLQLVVEWLAAARTTIAGSPVVNHEWEPPLPYVSFANHPDQEFVGRDDSLTQRLPLNTPDGRMLNIVHCLRGPISFIRATHQWQTAAYTRQTATIQNHVGNLCGFWVNFSFIPISVNMVGNDDVQNFESIDLNERFTVCCWNPRFAPDVFNPRQPKFFLRFPALSLGVDQNGVITARDPKWPLEKVEIMLFLLHGFSGRIPDFVWCELGIWPGPVPEVDALPPGC